MSNKIKTRPRPAPRPVSRSGSYGMMSVRTSRIVFAVLAFVVILTMVIALAPAVVTAPS